MSHFNFGALTSEGEYISPETASKHISYKCPECERDVVFKKGKINRPHFAHKKSSDPCTYYTSRPSETQKHKEAKFRLKFLIDKGINISINKIICSSCKKSKIINLEYHGGSFCQIEHRFEINGQKKIADLAYIDSSKNISFILEVLHTHKTIESARPEPWFELGADDILQRLEIYGDDCELCTFKCLRECNYTPCNDCIKKQHLELELFKLRERQKMEEERKKKIEEEEERQRKEEEERQRKEEEEEERQRKEEEERQRQRKERQRKEEEERQRKEEEEEERQRKEEEIKEKEKLKKLDAKRRKKEKEEAKTHQKNESLNTIENEIATLLNDTSRSDDEDDLSIRIYTDKIRKYPKYASSNLDKISFKNLKKIYGLCLECY